jgi:hypothetical protein
MLDKTNARIGRRAPSDGLHCAPHRAPAGDDEQRLDRAADEVDALAWREHGHVAAKVFLAGSARLVIQTRNHHGRPRVFQPETLQALAQPLM